MNGNFITKKIQQDYLVSISKLPNSYIKIVTATATVLSLSKPIMAIYTSQHNKWYPCLVLIPLCIIYGKLTWTMVPCLGMMKEIPAAPFLMKWWSSQNSICSTQQDFPNFVYVILVLWSKVKYPGVSIYIYTQFALFNVILRKAAERFW